MRKTSCQILRPSVICSSAMLIYLCSPSTSDAAPSLGNIPISSILPNAKSSKLIKRYSRPQMQSAIEDLVSSVISLMNDERIKFENNGNINLSTVKSAFPDFMILTEINNDQYSQIRLKLKDITKAIPCFANAVIGLTKDGKEALFDTVIPPGGCLVFDDHMLSAKYGPPTYSQSGPPPGIGLGHDVGLPYPLSLLSYQYKGTKNESISIMIWADLKNKRLYEVRIEKKEK